MFVQNEININFFLKKLLSEILDNFEKIKKTQGEALCLAMMNKCRNEHHFKSVMRDFLVCIKTFLGNDEAFWEEERKRELESA